MLFLYYKSKFKKNLSNFRNLYNVKNIEIIYLYQKQPFSLEYILFCHYRVQKRKSHETLCPGKESMTIVGSFVNMFKGFQAEGGIEINWTGKVGG